ncbi:Uncharacterized protein dnm_005780 [Desulfonema magnum]|uniref:Uncharacterized protein n=1 Tax=Desulfonema magnum TaxID=45655 RepID=A0A975BG48_9BACT|nr:Uncharacterized protein dnm_005780 [Desulfonema magnum]
MIFSDYNGIRSWLRIQPVPQSILYRESGNGNIVSNNSISQKN